MTMVWLIVKAAAVLVAFGLLVQLALGAAGGGGRRRSGAGLSRGAARRLHGRRSGTFWALLIAWALVRVAARFVLGLPLNGERRTDATMWHPGDTALGDTATWWSRGPSRWAYLPYWKRAVARWALVGLAVAWWRWRTPVTVAVALAVVAAAVYGGWRAYMAVRLWHHTRRYVRPLHVVLSRVLNLPEGTKPYDWLEVPVDFRDDNAKIRVELPAEFTGHGDVRKLITGIVTDKLGLAESEMEPQFSMVGAAPYVEFSHAPRPPEKVSFKMAREAIEAATDSAPVIGFGRRNKVIAVDLDSESPHVLLSMGTGAGKSIIARGQAAQQLHNGARVVVLDVKRSSHRWARGLPGVEYYRDPEDIHEFLLWLEGECDRRNAVIDEQGEDAADVGPRYLIVAEELNAMIRRLQKYWDRIRSNKDRRPSPAVEAFGDVLFMGRAGKINVLGIGQLATARALGGPEARENFYTRILGRYTMNAWRMLVPEVWPAPKSSRKRGRVQVVIAGEADETQAVYWSEDEARAWATSGAAVPVSQADARRRSQGERPGTVPEPAAAGPEMPPAETEAKKGLVGLGEACMNGILKLSDSPRKTLEIARSARKRDPEFPEAAGRRGQELLYRVEDLERWQRNRPTNVIPADSSAGSES